MSTPTHPDFAHPDSVNPSSTEHVPARIVVSELSKKFGTVQAVDRLSFVVEPGQVTGFLGPNGAGKTTTLRMVLDLITPDSGSATYGGVPYSALPKPSSLVGAVLETAFHPGRSGRNHLLVYCAAAGLPSERADAVLEQVGMTDAARRKTGGYSMGMRQRLGLAAALLGDPQVLILDEPANGLDPEGIQWLRNFLRHLAHDQGRTILVSSHLLAEVQQTVDRIVIIAAGRLVREGTIADLADPAQASVHVRSPSVEALRPALIEAGAHVEQPGPGELSVRGMPIAAIGHLAFTSGVELHELRSATTDLEEIYFRLTAGQEQFKGASHDSEAPALAAPEVQAS